MQRFLWPRRPPLRLSDIARIIYRSSRSRKKSSRDREPVESTPVASRGRATSFPWSGITTSRTTAALRWLRSSSGRSAHWA